MAVESTKLMTADDLWALPDHGGRRELIRGLLTPEPVAPGTRHGRRSAEIIFQMKLHLRAFPVGEAVSEVGFTIGHDPDTVRAPDAAFIAADRVEAIGDTAKYWPEAPALAVEVISPSDTLIEVEAKAQDWLDAGTKLVLVINPVRQSVTVHASGGLAQTYVGAATVDLNPAVPGWQLALSDLFS